MKEIIAVDRLLSVWIVLYAYLYIFDLTPYNPIMLLYIAYSFVIFASIIITFEGGDMNKLLFFILLNSVFKLVPIILIWHRKFTINDIIFTCIFIILYVIYMKFVQDDVICLYKDLISYVIDENKGRETGISWFVKNMLGI